MDLKRVNSIAGSMLALILSFALVLLWTYPAHPEQPGDNSLPAILSAPDQHRGRTPLVRIPAGPFLEGMQRGQLALLGREFAIDPSELAIAPQRKLDLPIFFIEKYE